MKGENSLKSYSPTNVSEQKRDGLILVYKYIKTLYDTQYKAFVGISTRHDARVKLPDHDERHFRIPRDDRVVILERMAEKYPNVVERCKENFAYKGVPPTLCGIYNVKQ